ncbi:hypothetical protein [Jatrophihabitans lederbergiae]|uniref:Uncharacterized protein n=1 Tax=Jatrophihabitans lederbergiae TaxID=3075547 RepID=A0ABU2J8C4_9ACTN|nr:hypothetical protein [Jatrophihabitans sp. DSM 44399]MDT0261235.1 hypothetical protein [Jatrophihabitans sp. DSM 44399]
MTTSKDTTHRPTTAPASSRQRSRTHPGGADNSQAAEHAVQATSSHVHLSLGTTTIDVTMPPVDKLAFYLGLTAAAALGVIEWPIAAVTGIGHLLSDDRGNRALRALGEALDAA